MKFLVFFYEQVQNMNSQHLQAKDFALALQEMGTYVDVSVDDLLLLHKKAEKQGNRLAGLLRTKGEH